LSVGDPDSSVGGPAAPTTRTKIRIESLSDLVFGLALSIGSLILVGKGVQSAEDLVVNVLLFGFGFLIILMVWLRYSQTMAVLPVEARFALPTNLALLFLVALEPYLFYVCWSAQLPGVLSSATAAYALDVGGMLATQAALAQLVVREAKAGFYGNQPLSPIVLAEFRRVVRLNAVLVGVFVVSALPVFWVDTQIGQLRYYLWAASFLVSLIGLVTARSRVKHRADARS
jgi:hypothetical protein